MKEYSCPSCGAKIVFNSLASLSLVCGYCDSLVVRHDEDLENLGKIATLKTDLSPLQLGTQGKFSGRSFLLIGRIRQDWEDGYWNEWYLAFSDGKFGWLGEAQGLYALSEPAEMDVPPKLGKLKIGEKIEVRGKTYFIQDSRNVSVTAAEGELPFKPVIGEATRSVDAIGDGGIFVGFSLDAKSDKAGSEAYVGQYLEFNDIAWSNLRELPGWERFKDSSAGSTK